ncbi:MAG: hypothetical protein ABI577_12735 [bacterium]
MSDELECDASDFVAPEHPHDDHASIALVVQEDILLVLPGATRLIGVGVVDEVITANLRRTTAVGAGERACGQR